METAHFVTIHAGHTLGRMVRDGHYDWVNRHIISRSSLHREDPGEYELVLVHFDYEIMAEHAITKIRKLGLEPAFIGILLAFGMKYPEIQRQFPIVAVRSVVEFDGARSSPILSSYRGERILDLQLYWCDYGFRRYFRFLAYRRVTRPPVLLVANY